MLVMWTAEDPANPLGKLVCAQQTFGLYHLTFAMDPLGLYGVQPRALFWQKAAYYPHSFAAVLDAAVVLAEPPPYLFGDVPARVVPDEDQDLLTRRSELLATPPEELGRYRANGPTVHETQPRLIEPRQVEPVAGDGLRLGIVFGDRLLNEAQRLPLFGPAAQGWQGQPTPPALVQEAHRPLGRVGLGHLHQSVAPPFFLSYKGSGEPIQRFARCHLTPRRRPKVALMVSPETRLPVSPSSKATCAAISSVQRLESWPNSLGERWSISRKRSALSSSKTARVLLGREEPGVRASRPLSLKSWMASRTVCCPQPRFSAIRGTSLPFEEARSICERRRVKASLERSPAWRVSCSFSESERTKMGVFMATTVTHNPKPILKVH